MGSSARDLVKSELPIHWSLDDLERSVNARFETIARLSPQAIALEYSQDKHTYRELDQAANQLAHLLSSKFGPSQLALGILMQPGFEFFAAYLGTLKSGNICVPLDPRTPALRLQALVNEIRPSAILINEETRDLARSLATSPTLLESTILAAGQPVTSVEIELGPDDPTLICLTSGSTGEPKGVVRSHRTMLHHAWVYSEDQRIQPTDRQSFLYSIQSGASMPDMLGAFLNGASLHPFDPRGYSLTDFANWLRNSAATLLHLPAPLFRLLLDELDPGELLTALRAVLVGGEAVFRDDIARGRQHVSPDCVFIHQMASTETNYISRFFIHHDTPLETEIIPVGVPARDKEVLIVDSRGRAVKPGEIGEITVRSRYLSLGYWNDQKLTQSKFNPVPDDVQSRTYKTGDLGKFDSNDILQLIGRKDEQVRIRSHRVELAAVAAAVQTLEEVRQAVVVARRRPEGDQTLIAYIVPSKKTSSPALDSIREQLGRFLPEHMLPSALVRMEEMPLLASGKIDKEALPPISVGRPDLQIDYEAPGDTYEERLVSIWEQVLGIRPIGVHDTFFGLGGHSLQAMRLIAKISEELGEDLPQASLLEASTVQQQALLLRTESSIRPRVRIVGIQPGGSNTPFFCVSPWVVDVLAYRDLALELGPDQPFYALYNVGLPELAPGQSRIEQEASAFVEDVLRISPNGPYQLGGYSHGGIVAIEMANLLSEMGKQVSVVVMFDVYGPEYREMLTYLPRWTYRPLQTLRSFQRAVIEFVPWLKHQLGTIGRLSGSRQTYYVLRKTANRLRWWSGRVKRLWRRLFTISRASHTVHFGSSFLDHTPRPYSGKVALLRASRQPIGIKSDPQMGWRGVLHGSVEVYEVPGFHDSILSRPHIAEIAGKLEEILRGASRQPTEENE